jgi:hypothetical protein
MSGCTARGSTKVMRRALLLLACAFFIHEGLSAQWVVAEPPVSGSVVALAVCSEYVYIGTTRGHVWRRPVADFTTGTAAEEPRAKRSSEVTLASFPNPCNASTVFTVRLPRAATARLVLYDMIGRSVMVILERRLEAGPYRFPVDMGSLASGVYVAVLNVDDVRLTTRLMLIR